MLKRWVFFVPIYRWSIRNHPSLCSASLSPQCNDHMYCYPKDAEPERQKKKEVTDRESGVLLIQHTDMAHWMHLTLGISGGFSVRLQSPSQLNPSNHLNESRESTCETMFPSTGLSVCLEWNKSVFLLVLLNVLGPISSTAQPLRGIVPWWWKVNENTHKKYPLWIYNHSLSFKRWCYTSTSAQFFFYYFPICAAMWWIVWCIFMSEKTK